MLLVNEECRAGALKRRLEEIIAQHSGQPLEKVSKDMERDYFMSAEEAFEYGCGSQKLARRLLRARPADGNGGASRRVLSGIGSTDAYSASAA